MPVIDPNDLSPVDRYRLLIGCIVPRPIAWITSVDAVGTVNLAPFSFFNGVTSRPPTVQVSIGPREPVKDTLANVRAKGEAVIHLPWPGSVEAVHQSGAEYKHAVSESDQLGLATTPSEVVAPPRLVDAQIALECRLSQEVAIGEPAATVCFFEILRAHIADDLAGADGLPEAERLSTIARLGGRSYLDALDWRVVSLGKQQVAEDLKLERRK